MNITHIFSENLEKNKKKRVKMTTAQLISANLAALAVGLSLGYAIVNDGETVRQVVFFPTGGTLENKQGMRCNCVRSSTGTVKWEGKTSSTTRSCNKSKGKPYNYYTTPGNTTPKYLSVPSDSCCQLIPKIGSQTYDGLGLC